MESVNRRERFLGLFFSLALGFFLAFTFLPSIHHLELLLEQIITFQSLQQSKIIEMALFAAVASFLFITLPNGTRSSKNEGLLTLNSMLPSFVVPITIAFIFGVILRTNSFVQSQDPKQELFWVVVCIPIGEELLFRGWLWAIFRTLFKGRFFTLTNPLPAELVLSSLAFSIWHIQNRTHFTIPFLIFQILYTLFTGLWLGYLRWCTGKISSSLLAHMLINLAASLPTLVW